MSFTPFAHAESLRIGTVDFISPNEVRALLDIEAPDSVALNAGGARAFPRVNGYLLMPVDGGYLVAQVEWLTIERSSFPKRRGVQDFGLIDLPYPLRRMRMNPLGMLCLDAGPDARYQFRRGADALPSLGTPVLLPTDIQLHAIVESGANARVCIGSSPLAGNAKVCVDPDRLFGRHLAVLGNTGSGKSCSVAGLIRWSLEAARSETSSIEEPNARFVVLDPNGEYARAFSDGTLGLHARIFRVSPEASELAMRVPLWLWNSSEWAAFAQASTKTQRPVLMQALAFAREGRTLASDDETSIVRSFLRTVVATLRLERHAGTPWGVFPKPKGFCAKLEKWQESLEARVTELEGEQLSALKPLVELLSVYITARRVKYASPEFTLDEVCQLIEAASNAHTAFGGIDSETDSIDVDSPMPFTAEAFLRCVEGSAEMLNVADHAETLLVRIRGLLKDSRLMPIIGDCPEMSLADWLGNTIGEDGAANGSVSILDLSLVPTEVVHVITAVVARLIFEALQRYRKLTSELLPTVLVMEEAHTFIKRYKDDVENHDIAAICCQVFERIAREGRKFGLGLVLSSQRPSELSQTVLAQCNTFLLHRLSNDRDQELVSKLLPDSLHGLLGELPSLPSQHAILLGWASELPVLVRMRDLPKTQRPHSDDPDFWNVWTGVATRKADWKSVADDWQRRHPTIVQE